MSAFAATIQNFRFSSPKSFEQARADFERQLGHLDSERYKRLVAAGDRGQVETALQGMAGPSGLMIFLVFDHGALLKLVGDHRQALQYLVGNPALALQMTQHDVRASLYAPLRVLLYEDQDGGTTIEYDGPASLFGQFGNAQVDRIARQLDDKIAALATTALE
jgi:uncharacterized protein (DUF302 family)